MKYEPEPNDLASLDEVECLREENARLKALLVQHGISWDKEAVAITEPRAALSAPVHAPRTAAEKIALFRRLFRGRDDVYPLRWESAKR